MTWSVDGRRFDPVVVAIGGGRFVPEQLHMFWFGLFNWLDLFLFFLSAGTMVAGNRRP